MKQGRTGADTLNARAPENSPPSRKTAEPAFGGCRGLSQPRCRCWSSYSPRDRPGGGVGGQRAFSGSEKRLPGARHSRSAAYAARRYLWRTAVGGMAIGGHQDRWSGCVWAGRFGLAGPMQRAGVGRRCPFACTCEPQTRRSRSRARTSRERVSSPLASLPSSQAPPPAEAEDPSRAPTGHEAPD